MEFSVVGIAQDCREWQSQSKRPDAPSVCNDFEKAAFAQAISASMRRKEAGISH
jgi:hypothetical protein